MGLMGASTFTLTLEDMKREGWAEKAAALEARKGRARFLGARSVGHADAGATSLALVLRAWAEVFIAGNELDPG